VHELHAIAIIMYQTEMKDIIFKAANVDLQYKNLVAKLQQRERPQTKESYTLGTNGLLLYKKQSVCTKCLRVEAGNSKGDA
jgi:hypothetical protein